MVDRLVDSLVDGLRVVALALVDLMGLSVSGVLDIHDSARVLVGHIVGHGLEAAVGEGNMVAAVSGVAVPGLVGAKLHGVLVVVIGVDAVLVLVLGRAIILGLFVGRLVVGGCRLVNGGVIGVRRGGQGNGQECREGNEDLKQKQHCMKHHHI